MSNRIFIVYDRNVEAFALKVAHKAAVLMNGGKEEGSDKIAVPTFAITADEEHKTIETVMRICRWLLSEGADRKAIVYAVGGGVTTDMVGFAASIYKRGVRYVNYPTTLLSQVDAGIGGKTGVNLDSFKNMIGVTRFPADTRIFPETLKTLPPREFRSGAAEMLKTFIIEDKGNYEKAVKVLSDKKMDFDALGRLIQAAGDVKRKIVEKDPFEENLRRVLNLGHTYGHAIEWFQHTHETGSEALSHGEAVAIGIIQAARLSEELGVADEGLADKLTEDFKACHLPTELPCPVEELDQAIWKDKKAENGVIHFILIKKIGKVIIKDLNDLHQHTK